MKNANGKSITNTERLRELTLFAMFGALMFLSKLLMDFLPNIHLIAAFIAVFTRIYRYKALIPIYVYVVLTGLYYGFNAWWVPYTYIWTLLWAVLMLIPTKISDKKAALISHITGVIHGLLFGTLWAPLQALLFNLSFSSTVKWIIAGLPYDCIHAAGNLVSGFIILPLIVLLKKLKNNK